MEDKRCELDSKETIKRFLEINRTNNCIDLSNSYVMYGNKTSKLLFQSEIYEVTFKDQKHCCNLYLTPNELICDNYIETLKEDMNIDIHGDGSRFEVVNYSNDFKIEFDTENTSFVNTNTVNNGVIYFYKE